MNDDQAERLIDVLARLHLEIHAAFTYLRENSDKWVIWLSGQRGS